MGLGSIALLGLACALAFGCGAMAWSAWASWLQARRHRESLVGSEGDGWKGRSLSDLVIGLMERSTRRLRLPGAAPRVRWPFGAGNGFGRMARLAGLEGVVSPEGYCEARLGLMAMGTATGIACGLALSPQITVILGIAFGALGWQLPPWALRSRVAERASDAERHLPEMLDVVALGMRSGLSFDSSLRIYASHFDTAMARELESARVQWSAGLLQREEALRSVASTYDSALLARAMDTVAKSIRFGSSMAGSLEADAQEARSSYQSRREERIAKAPVKMMVPTGVLILPAMLILVLGPVLLELVQGGF